MRQRGDRLAADGGPEAGGPPPRYARRAQLRAAVFAPRDRPPGEQQRAAAGSVAAGIIAQLRPDVIVLDTARGTESFAVSPATVTWLGEHTPPSALRPGDQAVIRHRGTDGGAPGGRLAERIWVRIGRVTGTIVAADGREFLVDTAGRDGPPRRVVLAAAAQRRIQVRFPRLAPGYLLDVIGTRESGLLVAVAPATAQPPYRAGHQPASPLVSTPVPASVSGSAVWHEPDGEPPGLLGLGYPALDPETGGRQTRQEAGCVRLPYLSLGSAVRISNECAGRSAVLPVTSDGAVARQFCDRCLECGTSPRGRVADLTMTAFAELGGNLEEGCFNATMTPDLTPGAAVTAPDRNGGFL
ncbi:MAG TPA: hypothetical protein VGD91_19300 [Trebonia sp.]